MEEYKKAIDHSFQCADLNDYVKEHILPLPGDWPTWFYTKKLIAQNQEGNNHYKAIIPEQGPFHVTLNAHEDIIKIYLFCFLPEHIKYLALNRHLNQNISE